MKSAITGSIASMHVFVLTEYENELTRATIAYLESRDCVVLHTTRYVQSIPHTVQKALLFVSKHTLETKPLFPSAYATYIVREHVTSIPTGIRVLIIPSCADAAACAREIVQKIYGEGGLFRHPHTSSSKIVSRHVLHISRVLRWTITGSVGYIGISIVLFTIGLYFGSISFIRTSETLQGPFTPLYAVLGIRQHVRDVYRLGQIATELRILRTNITIVARELSPIHQSATDRSLLFFRLERDLKRADELLAQVGIVPPWVPRATIWNTQLQDAQQMITVVKDMVALYRAIIPIHTDSTIAVLFANNKELRPGGGFIGSFVIVKTVAGTVQDWHVYDVYDADGQLKDIIEPPYFIGTHLQQPYLYLRDSNFEHDHFENAKRAMDFIQREMGISVNSVVLVTQSVSETLLDIVGPIPIRSAGVTLTRDNAYLLTQSKSEREFFPGSTAKKDFLKECIQELLLRADQYIFQPKHIMYIQRLLQSKQIVFASFDPHAQKVFDTLFVSGATLPAQCVNTSRCILDYFLYTEANIGVNKANAFVHTQRTHAFDIGVQGQIEETITIRYTNASYPNVYPGGTYKAYVEFVPNESAQVVSLVVDGSLPQDYRLIKNQGAMPAHGFVMTVLPQKTIVVQIKLVYTQRIAKGSTLELVFPKQIGAMPLDLKLVVKSLELPVMNTNIGLASRQFLEYTTNLDADKYYVFHF